MASNITLLPPNLKLKQIYVLRSIIKHKENENGMSEIFFTYQAVTTMQNFI